jgi:branched-chain amino acid aminotransferase
MAEPIAYLNGEYVPISEAKLSVYDLGVVQGAAVTEMIRTYAHQPFRLGEHLDRLDRSLRFVGFDLPLTRQEMETITGEVVGHNGGLIPQNHDLGIVMFVTAGENLTYVGAAGL